MRVKMPAGTARKPREKAERPRETIRCPKCGSHRLSPEIAFIGGANYLCRDCGYQGAFVVKGEPESEGAGR